MPVLNVLIDASAAKGIRARPVLPDESCGAGALIDLEESLDHFHCLGSVPGLA
jgi:hypothetical protein